MYYHILPILYYLYYLHFLYGGVWWVYRPYIDFHTIFHQLPSSPQGVPVPTEEMPLLEGPNGPQEGSAPTEKGLGGLC